MKAEKEKMLAGELYDPFDPQLCGERQRARELLKRLNDSREEELPPNPVLLRRSSRHSPDWPRSRLPWVSAGLHSRPSCR